MRQRRGRAGVAVAALLAPLLLLAAPPAAWAKPQPAGGASGGDGGPAPAKAPVRAVNNTAADDIEPRSSIEGQIKEELLDGYDKMNYPWEEHGPCNVSLNIVFNKVLNVDLYGGVMRVSVWYRLRWNDPRLRWDGNATGVKDIFFDNMAQDQLEIWFPDVTLWNAATDISSTLGIKWPRVSSNGDIFWTRNGILEVACNFKGLEAYPFGRVSCELEVGSWAMAANKMDLWPFKEGATIGLSLTGEDGAQTVEYSLINATARRHVYGACAFPPCGDEWPVILFNLTLVRASVLYTFKILLPQIVLTMVAFSTFWLSPDCGERLGLAITVPLAVAVYDLLVFNSLPTSNRINFVSAMGLLAFLFSIAVLVLNALIIQLWFYREPSYFGGMVNIANTMLSYREQCVWVEVLRVLHDIKLAIVRQQRQLMAKNRPWKGGGKRQASIRLARPPRASADRAPSALDAGGDGFQPNPSAGMFHPDASLHAAGTDDGTLDSSFVSEGGPMGDADGRAAGPNSGLDGSNGGGAAPGAYDAPPRTSDGAGDQGPPSRHVALAMGDGDADAAPRGPLAALRRRMRRGGGGPVDGAELGVVSGVVGGKRERIRELEDLLSSEGPAGLQASLEKILGDVDPRLAHVRRKVERAVAVFGGTDVLASRLYALLMSNDHDHPAAGSHGTVSLAEWQRRVSDAYGLKWQLLSSAIDHTCRWVFVLTYLTAVATTAATLTRQ